MTVLSNQDFVARIKEIAAVQTEPFRPFVFHNTDGDCLEFFVSQNDYFAERIDDYLTLYLDMDSEQIVGFVIKNVRRILERLARQESMMAFVIDDGAVRLRSLFVAMFADTIPKPKRDVIVRKYQSVVELAETNKLEKVALAYA